MNVGVIKRFLERLPDGATIFPNDEGFTVLFPVPSNERRTLLMVLDPESGQLRPAVFREDPWETTAEPEWLS